MTDSLTPASDELVYAIGDIHGCLGPLRELQAQILDDSARRPARCRTLVYLGDYISRGSQSRAVVEAVRDWSPPGFARVFLKGNHEDLLLRFVDGELDAGRDWFAHGGLAVLAEYGLAVDAAETAAGLNLTQMRQQIIAVLPAADLRFFRALATEYRSGNYCFVHGGIRPGVSLAAQTDADRMWMRQPFLDSTLDHGAVIVHGHSIAAQPQVRTNRIGIDTGAFRSGILTCLVVQGGAVAFLQTGAA